MLVKSMYPCQDVPVVVFGKRCPKPCLYCDLKSREFSKEEILAQGQEEVIQELRKHKGAYFSAVSDTFLEENQELTHNIIKNVWKTKENFVPLIVTKQIIPEKTINLLIENKHRVVVQISVPSLNEKLVSILEPGAATIKQRLETAKKLSLGGVAVTAVIMPWFNIYEEGESIEDLPKALFEAGIRRCIIGTVVLPEQQRNHLLKIDNELIVKAIKKMTQSKKVTTKIGYTLPFEEKIEVFEGLIKACEKYFIKPRICTADNPDLINKTILPLCTQFKHPNFGELSKT